MAEYEELRLIVTLDDKASVGLAKVRGEIEKLHGGSTGGAFDKVNKYTKDFSTSLRLVTEQTIDLTKSLGPVGLAFGGVAAGVLAAGAAFYNVGKQLKSFSEATLSLSAMARTLGILPGQFKALSEQLARVMSKETADKNVLEFGKTMQEFGRIGSEAKAEWIRAAGGGGDAITLIEQVTGLARGGQLDQAMQLYIDGVNASYEKNRKNADQGGVGEQQAAYQRRQMLERAGLSVEVLELRDRLKAATQKQIDDEEERLQLAKDFNREWNETMKALARFQKAFVFEIMPEFTKLNVSINASGKDWGEGLGKFIHNSVVEVETIYKIVKDTIDLLNSTPEDAFSKWKAATGRVNPRTTQPYHTAPRMQHGGLVTRPTMAMIGESGPEAVVPLSSGGMNANMRGGWANMPISQNIEDRRGKQLEENTEQLRELNKKLTEEKYGALSTGSYGTGGSVTGAGADSGSGAGSGRGPGGTSSGPSSGPTGPTVPPALAVPGKEGGGVTYGAGDSPALGTPAAAPTAAGSPGVPAEGMAMLDTVATREAEPAFDKQGNRAGWNTMVGGARFDPNTDEHPHKAYPGMRGYLGPAGRSYASGRYQETTNTYYENVARSRKLHPGMKVSGWSPEAQNLRNWDKMQEVYRQNYRKLGIDGLTGDMQKDLQTFKDNPEVIGKMSRTLSGEWTSAPGGHEASKQTGGKESYYSSTYQKMLAKTSQEAQPAAAGAPADTGGGQAGNPPQGPYYGQKSGYGTGYGGGSTAGEPAGSPTAPGDPRLTTVGNYTSGRDPRRDVLIAAATEASKNLPPGYKIEAYSGQRSGADQGPHRTSGAIDFRIVGPDGKALPNYQDPKTFSTYEKFAQDTHIALEKLNPQLAALHRWGGYFSGNIGKYGKYGAMDEMHQDFAGGDARMAAGQWSTGVNKWGQRWGVRDSSPGLAARRKELDRMAAEEAKRKIEGNATVKVNVPYTSPKHKSPVFKDVPMERPTQMQKADDGQKFGQASLESTGAI